MTEEEIKAAADAKTAAENAEAAAKAAKTAEDTAKAAIKAAEDKAEADRKNTSGNNKADADMIAKLVQDRLDTELAQIKKSLDGAYKQRDDALAKVAAQEARDKEATLKKMEEDGKYKEAFELRLAEEKAKNDALQRRNTELSRDVSVRDALKGMSFRNDKASEMAFKEITSQLVQNEQGQWVHRSGISVHDFCDAFARDDDQAFLFKSKPNSGSGTTTTAAGTVDGTTKKSLFAMSQDEVIKLAAAGKLGKHSTF